MIVERSAIIGESGCNGLRHAVHVDVQLVLAARPFRVDRQRDRLARQRSAETRLNQRFGLPAVGEDGGRVGREHHRILDATDAAGWDGEHLRDADEILEDRNALGLALAKIHGLAGFWSLARLGMGQAGAMDNAPQSRGIGPRREMSQEKDRGCGRARL